MRSFYWFWLLAAIAVLAVDIALTADAFNQGDAFGVAFYLGMTYFPFSAAWSCIAAILRERKAIVEPTDPDD